MNDLDAFQIKVKGLVQGVAFRYYTKVKADSLHLVGWVRNLEDGTVLIEISGKRSNLEEFIEWCHEGSPAARVKELHFDRIKYFLKDNFDIIR